MLFLFILCKNKQKRLPLKYPANRVQENFIKQRGKEKMQAESGFQL